jgi:hypothetical protein
MLKNLLCLVALGLFSAALVGCSASAEVGDADGTSRTSSSTDTYKKTTTTVEPDGDRTTRTEVKVDR